MNDSHTHRRSEAVKENAIFQNAVVVVDKLSNLLHKIVQFSVCYCCTKCIPGQNNSIQNQVMGCYLQHKVNEL